MENVVSMTTYRNNLKRLPKPFFKIHIVLEPIAKYIALD